ncbi:B3/B4 domain-containing protein [Bacillus massilinigeriensis]|uniref:B3/B4 domain-containing protein n=1 Tax=Bacillus mediterraneensis TaxID=1805474 RepID=UPI0008F89B83|nr:phenylalanine--tRNA ligase beta subunit-related protein [Bacillus mediterraneensis]
MEVTLLKELSGLLPGFSVGVITFSGVQIGPSPQMLKGRLRLFQESLYFDLEGKKVTELEGIGEWRSAFKLAGRDPNRSRHSAEALYRRVQKGEFLPSVHSAVDLNNFFSLQYQVPIGVYDLDKIKGDVTIRIGMDGEVYEGLNGRENSLKGLILSSDESDPFGSPYVDSKRTAVTEDSENILSIIYHRPSLPLEEKRKMTASLMEMFLQIHGGVGNYEVVSS